MASRAVTLGKRSSISIKPVFFQFDGRADHICATRYQFHTPSTAAYNPKQRAINISNPAANICWSMDRVQFFIFESLAFRQRIRDFDTTAFHGCHVMIVAQESSSTFPATDQLN
jgi:hypothetical protein